uniref:Uncharacterized protein n=1 Tax=Populus trichocarpa TaxID=3694 RepID=B9IH62_POPTR
MSKMSPEVLQKMFEMASSSRGNDLVPAVASALNTDGSSSFAGAKPIETRGKFTVNKNDRDQMKDPTMQQMFISMMKYLSPENMATISEHLGINSQEDEDKAQQAMSSFSPEDSDKTM